MRDTEILATGPEFVREGVRGIEPVLEELIQEASDEIQIVAYVITERASHILSLLDNACSRGVKVTLIINKFHSQANTIKTNLKHLVSKYRNIQVIDFYKYNQKQVHAKALVVDRRKGIIGSANLSWNGMYGNYEIGVFISKDQAWMVARIIDILGKMGKQIS